MKDIYVEFKDGTVLKSQTAIFPRLLILWWNVFGIEISSSDGLKIKPMSSVNYIHIV